MNKKLIAAAVSATVMAPVVATAQDEGPSMTVYGRINQAITFRDSDAINPATGNKYIGTDSSVDVSNISSRFGMKASADVGNGMTAIGRFEFSTGADRELPAVNDVRLGIVGLSGSFGSVTIGNQYSSYSTLVGTHFDPTYTLGYFIYSQVGAPYRASNTIKYANTFGPVSLGVDLRLNDAEEGKAVAEGTAGSIGANGNGWGISGSVAASDNVTIAAGWDQEQATDGEKAAGIEDQDLFGIAAQASFGGFWGSIGWQQMKDGFFPGDKREQMQIYLGTSFGEKTSAMVGYGAGKLRVNGVSADTKPTAWNVGVYHSLGGGMKLYYENLIYDADRESAGSTTFDSDASAHYFGMRIDF